MKQASIVKAGRHDSEVTGHLLSETLHVVHRTRHSRCAFTRATDDAAALHPRLELLVPCVLPQEIDNADNELLAANIHTNEQAVIHHEQAAEKFRVVVQSLEKSLPSVTPHQNRVAAIRLHEILIHQHNSITVRRRQRVPASQRALQVVHHLDTVSVVQEIL